MIHAGTGTSTVFAAFFTTALFLFFPATLTAQRFLSITDPPSTEPVGNYADVLTDASRTITYKDAASPAMDARFIPLARGVPNFGYTTAACWMRLRVRNDTGRAGTWYVEVPYFLLDDLRLYIPHAGGVTEKKSGRLHPFIARDILHRTFSFALPLERNEHATLYLRALTKDSLPLPVHLMSLEQIRHRDTTEAILLGLYYGMILVMVVFNLIIFITTKDRNYLYSMLLLVTMHLFFQIAVNGLTFQYLGTDSLLWSRTAIAFFVSTGGAFAALMTMGVLNTRQDIPIAHRILQGVLVWACIEAVLSLVIDYYWAVQSAVIMAMVGGGIMFASGVWSLAMGRRAALFYMLSWPPIIIGGLIYGLKVWAFIPSNVYTEYGYQAGSALQALLLSVALADNINIMRKERFRVQNELLDKERQAREDQERFSRELEALVVERTTALNTTLVELKKKDGLLQEELNLAADIQQGILPHVPFSFNGIRITGYYNAMEKIGGDFYDIFPMKGGHLCVIISDASGHGIPAAFVTAMAKITFHETTQTLKFPRDIFAHVNDQMMQSVKTQDYLTAFMVIISPSYEVLYANASHPCAIVQRRTSGAIEEWDTEGLFLGAIHDNTQKYEEKQDFLDFGDRLFLYTDGLIESRDADGVEFGIQRLHELLRECADLPIDDARDCVVATHTRFTGDGVQRDDVSFLFLEIETRYRELLSQKNTGLEHLYHNQFAAAIGDFNRALAIDPANHEIHSLLGKCYYREKDYRQAVTHLEQYLTSNPDDADALSILAASLFNLREFERALEKASLSCMLRQNFTRGLEVMGMALMRLGRTAEAQPVWEQILKVDPQNMAALSELQRIRESHDNGEKGGPQEPPR